MKTYHINGKNILTLENALYNVWIGGNQQNGLPLTESEAYELMDYLQEHNKSDILLELIGRNNGNI